MANSSMHETVSLAFDDNACSPSQLSPLALAYIGDTLYDLYVRTHLLHITTLGAHGLHVKASSLVCAGAQAKAFRLIEPLLTEAETAIFKRGRNAQSPTVPKHADIADYRIATGLEALIGYLYLCGMDDRINELMGVILK